MIGGTRPVGPWTVTVDLAGVTAGPLEGSDVYRTTAIRFPAGWRIGKVWTNGVTTGAPELLGIPRRVVAAARSLARTLP